MSMSMSILPIFFLSILYLRSTYSEDIFLNVNFTSGYINRSNPNTSTFYWLFPSQMKSEGTPLFVLINSGGREGSSTSGIISIGPFTLDIKAEKLSINRFSYSHILNLLLLDMEEGYSNRNINSGEEMGDILNIWMKEHKEYREGDIYIGGNELSIPMANYLNNIMNIKGLLIFNPWLSDSQNSFRSTLAKSNNLVSGIRYLGSALGYTISRILNNLGISKGASFTSRMADGCILGPHPPYTFNPRDISKGGDDLWPYLHHVSLFMNNLEVKDLLGVQGHTHWTFNTQLDDYIYPGINIYMLLGTLLDAHVNVIITSAQFDFLVPPLGVQHALSLLQWEGKDRFLGVRDKLYFDSRGVLIGKYRKFGNLMHVNVNNGTHFLGNSHPSLTYELLLHLMNFEYLNKDI